MFSRKNNSYDFDKKLVDNVSKDEASPINRIFNLIPENSKVLDVGSGNGVLAKLFKYKDKNVIIDGIEPNKHASYLANNDYRKFYHGYIQDFMDEILIEKYDYIVFADVIEHIDNPIIVLKDFFDKLDISTKIVVSTPNIAFGAVRLSLMQGIFNYVDSGILEKTHLRFYTLDTLKKLVNCLDFNIEKLYFLNRNFNNMEIKLESLKLNPFLIYMVNKDKLSHVYQFLVVLSKEKKNCEEKYYGRKVKYPILEYFFKPIIMKNKKLKALIKGLYN